MPTARTKATATLIPATAATISAGWTPAWSRPPAAGPAPALSNVPTIRRPAPISAATAGASRVSDRHNLKPKKGGCSGRLFPATQAFGISHLFEEKNRNAPLLALFSPDSNVEQHDDETETT